MLRTSYRDTLARLAEVARPMDSGREWQVACTTLAEAREAWAIPPADIVAPAFLPEAGQFLYENVARLAVEYVLHASRLRDAASALARLRPGEAAWRRHVVDGGWTEDESIGAYVESEKERAALLRANRKES